MRYILFTTLVLLLSNCSFKSEPSDKLPSRILKDVEPFCVEHYEIKTGKDTSIVLYFNRDIKTNEEANIRIDIVIADEDYAYGVLPLPQNTKDKKIELKIPITHPAYTKKFPDIAPGGKLSKAIQQIVKDENLDYEIKFSLATSNAPPLGIFTAYGSDFTISDALDFKKRDLELGKKYDRFNSGSTPWAASHWIRYEGDFNDKGEKQGDWVWKYSNGKTKATAQFENDSLIGHFVYYRYTGELQDSISYEYQDTLKYKIQKAFYKDGTIRMHRGIDFYQKD